MPPLVGWTWTSKWVIRNDLSTTLGNKNGKIKDILCFSQTLKCAKKLTSWTKPSKNVNAHVQDLH